MSHHSKYMSKYVHVHSVYNILWICSFCSPSSPHKTVVNKKNCGWIKSAFQTNYKISEVPCTPQCLGYLPSSMSFSNSMRGRDPASKWKRGEAVSDSGMGSRSFLRCSAFHKNWVVPSPRKTVKTDQPNRSIETLKSFCWEKNLPGYWLSICKYSNLFPIVSLFYKMNITLIFETALHSTSLWGFSNTTINVL